MMNIYRPEGLLYGSEENKASIYGGRVALERAMQVGAILEGMVTLCDKELNLHVDLGGVIGIIPRSEVLYSADNDIKDIAVITRVGKQVCFKVTSISESGGRTVAYLSRRAAQLECLHNFVDGLIPGDVLCSRVTHLECFGAFIDIGCGIIALLPVDCMSVSRFSHPKDRLYKGMVINTVFKSFDKEKNRIFVSMRELLGTWEENAAQFSPGQTGTGIVRSVEDYGVFGELSPNLAGLAELKDATGISGIAPGLTAAVYIKSIIPERMKIKLVLIDTYINEDNTIPSFKYFVDRESTEHIAYWRYSPPSCARIIESVFE